MHLNRYINKNVRICLTSGYVKHVFFLCINNTFPSKAWFKKAVALIVK